MIHFLAATFGRPHAQQAARFGLGDDITGDTPLAPDAPTLEAVNACSPSGIAEYTKTQDGFKVVCNDGTECERGVEGITVCSGKKPGFQKVKNLVPLTPILTQACPPGQVFAPSIGKCIEAPSAKSCAKRGLAFDVSKKACVQPPKTRDVVIGDADACILQGLDYDPDTNTCVPKKGSGIDDSGISGKPPAEEPKGLSTGQVLLYGAIGVAGVAALYFGGKAVLGSGKRAANPVKKSPSRRARKSNPTGAQWIVKKRGKEYFAGDDKSQAFAVFYSTARRTPGTRVNLYYRNKADGHLTLVDHSPKA